MRGRTRSPPAPRLTPRRNAGRPRPPAKRDSVGHRDAGVAVALQLDLVLTRLLHGLDLLGALAQLADELVAILDHAVGAVAGHAPAVFLLAVAPLVAGEPALHAGVAHHLAAELAMAADQLRHHTDALLRIEQLLLDGTA